jgi:hypothetical protein
MAFDFEADLRFPAGRDDWLESVVIGTVLLLFSGFLLPLVPLQGYFVQCARAGMAGDAELPSFTDWEQLFGDGLRGLVVLVVYQLPPLVLGVASVAALVLLGSDNQSLASAGLILFGLGLLATFLLAVLSGYFGLVGLLSYAATDDLGAAFDLETLRSVGVDGDFLVHWAYGVALVFLLNALFGVVLFFVNIVAIIPIIGFIIALFAFVVLAPVGTALSFYAQQVVFRVWGRGYADVRGLARGDVPVRVGDPSPTAPGIAAQPTTDARGAGSGTPRPDATDEGSTRGADAVEGSPEPSDGSRGSDTDSTDRPVNDGNDAGESMDDAGRNAADEDARSDDEWR